MKNQDTSRLVRDYAFLPILVVSMAASHYLLGSPAAGVGLCFVLQLIEFFVKRRKRSDKRESFREFFSFKVFTNMSFYSQIAAYLSAMMYFCFIYFRNETYDTTTYLEMLLWLVPFSLTLWLSSKVIARNRAVVGLNLFWIGIVIWVLGFIFMFRATSVGKELFWTIVWGIGLSSLVAAINLFYNDFISVALIADEEVEESEMHRIADANTTAARTTAMLLMVAVLLIWRLFIPRTADDLLPDVYTRTMVQMPMLFMLISAYFALRQPLDRRNREKLRNYLDSKRDDLHIKESLDRLLVKKYRVRFGVKIMMAVVRPFLHLKVKGKEHLDTDHYPSVFVCNHGATYGPVSAVIYLPTYFRPWIHDVVLKRKNMAMMTFRQLRPKMRFLPRQWVWGLSWLAAGIICWVLKSFNPIPVRRGSSREVLNTFNLTLEALTEGDNILLFPEKPRETGQNTDFRELFTGFASLGKMYHKKSGKALRFYPIFTDSNKHTFTIGEPVTYNPENEAHAEKVRIANLLHEKIEALKKD